MNALRELKTLPFTREEQQNYADMAISEILSGDVDPVEADIRLKAMEEVIKKIRTDIRVKNYIVEEAEKYGKTFMKDGVKITVTSRTTKDYSNCGDDYYNIMQREAEHLKSMIKAREAMIDTGVNPETGETFSPPKTETSTFLTYKF